jgi:hypothetical protein
MFQISGSRAPVVVALWVDGARASDSGFGGMEQGAGRGMARFRHDDLLATSIAYVEAARQAKA